MIEKTRALFERYEELSDLLSRPEIASDARQSLSLVREQKRLEPIVHARDAMIAAERSLADAEEILALGEDEELALLAAEEKEAAKAQLERLEDELRTLLIPRDENDDKNVILEIRGGAGGEEAALFSAVLYRMYQMYCAQNGFKTEVLSANETELGGYKEITCLISGEGAYSRFKFESGTHRVQRVPETESQGRIHTSAVTVAVLPEMEEVEVEINEEDLEIDTHRASGAGGQHVNKTDSAIRILHKPTGIVVECQDERSQHKNREKALRVLRAKLYEAEQKRQADSIASARKSQVGSGDRSERIRTYNYPQGRITDHRIGFTAHNLEQVLNGKLSDLFEALTTADLERRMQESVG
ncbi:MAG: peptide chain release factor 1 [Clostridia bacterium]|nr:peptide chain release factor 1 [Clostridia bacterium]